MRLLLVEDSVDFSRALCKVLTGAGFAVDAANSGGGLA